MKKNILFIAVLILFVSAVFLEYKKNKGEKKSLEDMGIQIVAINEAESVLNYFDLNISLKFPSKLFVGARNYSAYDYATNKYQNAGTLRIVDPIGYGERIHCNESGQPSPKVIGDPDLFISVINKSWDQYHDEIRKEFSMDELEFKEHLSQYTEKQFDDGRIYYDNVSGVEMCANRYTFIPTGDERVVEISEPLFLTNVGDPDLKTIRGDGGKDLFGDDARKKIYESIRLLK